jgi:hypothetical protein
MKGKKNNLLHSIFLESSITDPYWLQHLEDLAYGRLEKKYGVEFNGSQLILKKNNNINHISLSDDPEEAVAQTIYFLQKQCFLHSNNDEIQDGNDNTVRVWKTESKGNKLNLLYNFADSMKIKYNLNNSEYKQLKTLILEESNNKMVANQIQLDSFKITFFPIYFDEEERIFKLNPDIKSSSHTSSSISSKTTKVVKKSIYLQKSEDMWKSYFPQLINT